MGPATSIATLHRAALEQTRATVRDLPDDAWDRATPCDEWSVRELTNHIVAGNLWAARLGAGETIEQVGDAFEGDVLGSDPRAAYDASVEPAAGVFERPGALEAPCAVSYGPVPGEVYAGHRFLDVLVHGWDLAVATGQDTRLPLDLVAAAWDVITPQLDLLRASGMFGEDRATAADADLQTRLLHALGRG